MNLSPDINSLAFLSPFFDKVIGIVGYECECFNYYEFSNKNLFGSLYSLSFYFGVFSLKNYA